MSIQSVPDGFGPPGAELLRRLIRQLDRIESGLGPRTLSARHVAPDQSGTRHLDVPLALEQAAREREALYTRMEALEKYLGFSQASLSRTFTANQKGNPE